MVNTPSSCRRRGVGSSSPRARTPEHELHETIHHGRHRHHHHHHHDELDRRRGVLEAVVALDHRVSAWVHEQGLGIFFCVFLRTLEFSADGVFLIPCAAAAFLAPSPKLTPGLRLFFFNLFMTFLFDLIFVSIVKKAVRRPRPAYNHGHFRALQVDHWSFPSGHSSRALITTTLFSLYMPMWRDQSRRIWMPYLLEHLKPHAVILRGSVHIVEHLLISCIGAIITGWALATTTSRIILGRHFLCDVLAGSLIGVAEALFAHRYLFIPMHNVEYVHSQVNQKFAWFEDSVFNAFSCLADAVFNVFQRRSSVVTHVKPR